MNSPLKSRYHIISIFNTLIRLINFTHSMYYDIMLLRGRYFMLVLNIMCKLFFAIILGYYLNKTDIFTEEINQKLSSFIIRFATPCLIVSSVTSISNQESNIAIQFLFIGIAIYIILPIFSYFLASLTPGFKSKKYTFSCMFMFSNCGFMALPIVQSIFGNEAIFYNTLLHMPYNLLFFTLGSYMLAKDGDGKYQFKPQSLLSPGIVASLAAIILFFFNIKLPDFISGSLNFIGSCVTPLSMISIGVSIACYPLKEIMMNKKLYLMSFIRLIIIPLTSYLIVSMFITNQTIIQIVTIGLAMPVGSLVAMGANEYHGDVKTASFGVALSTILSLITIPIILLLFSI